MEQGLALVEGDGGADLLLGLRPVAQLSQADRQQVPCGGQTRLNLKQGLKPQLGLDRQTGFQRVAGGPQS